MNAAALLCNICPKQPTFSDVSHLLTHISSKAHLSHYFKLQVRSHQEQQAIALLREYDRWYKVNNLARLLSDRMSSKEARKRRAHEKVNTKRELEHEATPPVPAAYISPPNPLPDYLDPRLSNPYIIGPEPKNESLPLPTNPSLASRTPTRKLMISGSSSWKQETGPDSDEEIAVQSTLHWSGSKADILPQHPAQYGYDIFTEDNDNDSVGFPTNSEMDKERADEIARLKGVLWPGMDIFDSATEQMRRRRNQKKDESILKMMEKTSLRVEPTELVFSPTGILRKQRVISGNVEDSSPLKGETPIPKRKSSRPKRALAQVDGNVHRGQDRKRSRKSTKRNGNSVDEDMAGRDIQGPLASQRPLCHVSRDDTDEFALSFKGNQPRPHNGFAIFRDAPDQYKASSTNHHCDGSHSATSASSHPIFLLQGFNAHGDTYPLSSNNHALALTERNYGMSMDKENIEPLVDVRSQIDLFVDWHSPSIKRRSVSDMGYPPQCFFGDLQPAGFSPFASQESPMGYSFNPLTVSLPRLPAEDNPMYTAKANHKPQPQNGEQPDSPGATISDVDECEFERLYLDGSSY
ncbi:hypothetical protein BO70DRAFT_322613 [Aspergillus heteromorphus CBS 117.55]|uniref:Uncharacterized protein n=1 Tax=Aspergillus heteromorphus CBS 117.55 TaxID=1448321 RepID=A0A317V955_9EURO|nr:uncharacterized protein BO70DRAFT_322613 [Aspergillus heteromorphus CBS 117.55]PWY69527.1 hypothetical protein BO70DRAFT_322613 [Aspergillus heteromorphus CBS 117.55]